MLNDNSEDKQKIINKVIELQRRADFILKQYVPDVWMELNLTVAQLKTLIFVVCKKETSSGRLAAALRVSPPNVTGIVDRLVKQGLINRTQNPENRRSLLLTPTEKGEEALTRLSEGVESHNTEVLKNMNEEDLLTLSQGLASLVRAAQEYEKSVEEETDNDNGGTSC